MKYILVAVVLLSLGVVRSAARLGDFSESPVDCVPTGIAASDWSCIRAAHEAALHSVSRKEDGTFVSRNPGQRWQTGFDDKGFTITPDSGGWTWGLELVRYGSCAVSTESENLSRATYLDGGKISFVRDACLTEWFINDKRGLEQGWTLKHRPERKGENSPLTLSFSIRGNLSPSISKDGLSASFLSQSGCAATVYDGLKAWDADGKSLSIAFEVDREKNLAITVQDQVARYPVTIDPVAQQAYLKASNSRFNTKFGDRVAVSGNTVVVGSYFEDSSATGVNGNQTNTGAPASGAVYVFVRNGETWSQQAYIKASNTQTDDRFGCSVAVSGDTIVVGAENESSSATGINGDQSNNSAFHSGAAYVFVRNAGVWSQQAYLKASNTDAEDIFGVSVAVSGDIIAVGAMLESSASSGINGEDGDDSLYRSGAAYIFSRSGTTWSQQAYVKVSNPDAEDYFGYALAISGNTVVVGAYQEDSPATGINGDQGNSTDELYGDESGAAYVFVRNGSTWSQEAYLKASNTGEYDGFGYSVSISGDSIVIGAYRENSSATGVNGDQFDENAPSSGAAYVFVRAETEWGQQAYLKASNTQSSDNFGHSVAISGNTLVVGAPLEDSNATGIGGNQSNNAADYSGAAYLFRRSGTIWGQQEYLKASNAEARDRFGASVAACCGTILVGAPNEASGADGVNGNQNDNGEWSSGAVYQFNVVLDDFENAMTAAGLEGVDALFDADPDNDGLANGLEWLLGGSPVISSPSVAPVFSMDTTNTYLTFNRLDLSECSALLKVQWSADLMVWNEVAVGSSSSSGLSITENGTSLDVVQVAVPRSNASGGKLFLRLVAEY